MMAKFLRTKRFYDLTALRIFLVRFILFLMRISNYLHKYRNIEIVYLFKCQAIAPELFDTHHFI